MLLKDIKNIFHAELDEIYPVEEVDSFFYYTVQHYLGLERFALVLRPNQTVTKEGEQPLFETLAQLKQEKPIQYILGTAHFMDFELTVNEHVLIPRPETEELVRWIIDDVKKKGWDERNLKSARDMGKENFTKDPSPLTLLDIGTGSGCIAIALAKNFPNAKIYALDVSKDALGVAQKNAKRNQVDITFIQQDILNSELKLGLGLELDIIVSNPPYVRESEKKGMRRNVKAYEPAKALFVPDRDPLKFYRAIVQLAKISLKERGRLYLEINQYFGKETKALLEAHNFSEIELRKDIFGNDRMLKAKI
ncbi:MAG: peptide chain release factor N(5)-glutamine methyltransferase [Allomuricauda sp.]